jgi:hypothetical protein
MLDRARKIVENRKLRQWQCELTKLSEKTGKSLDDVCEYIGLSYNRDVGFYVKIPKKRRMMIGIGMAFGQPLEVINRWIVTYTSKRKLYSKDISEDLIWIYLIKINNKNADSDINYFSLYDSYLEAAFETYVAVWNEVTSGSLDTGDVDLLLSHIEGDEGIEDLKNFVLQNIDSFKTAYSKPRTMLSKYVKCITETKSKDNAQSKASLISLRGWLDDSMINYLSGSSEIINVTDRRTGSRRPDLKQVPTNRKSHISLALALGLTAVEINRYLELMGYSPLNEEDIDEERLIKALRKWDEIHFLPRIYKEKYISENKNINMSAEEELKAVNEMLMLRQDLNDQYKRKKMKFPYVKA